MWTWRGAAEMCLAVPARIITLEGEGPVRSGTVSIHGTERSVDLSFVPEATVGDYVLTHSGLAVRRLDPVEAAETLELLGEAFGEQL